MSTDPQQLSLPLARQVFFASFYHSQGRQDQQLRLFRYIALHRPTWQLDAQMRKQLKTLNLSVQALVDKGLHKEVDQHEVTVEILHMVEKMHEVLNMNKEQREIDAKNPECLVEAIARDCISRDWYYLTRGGRPRKDEKEDSLPIHPRRDAYFSYICHYVFLGNPLRVTIFDELFAELRTLFYKKGPTYDALMRYPYAREELSGIIEVYNNHHPERHVTYKAM